MLEVRERGEAVIKKEVILEKARKLGLNERQVKAVMHVLDKGRIIMREVMTEKKEYRL